MTPLRVAVLADYLEEGWPSMDLMFEMLVEHLRDDPRFELIPVRPPMPRRFGYRADRMIARHFLYPRQVRNLEADVYHVVDHSYAPLVSESWKGRAVVTCHDADAFRPLFDPAARRTAVHREIARRVARGIARAAAVTCDSEATRREVVEQGIVDPGRITVVPLGVDGVFSPGPDREADRLAGDLLTSAPGTIDLLHVGSAVPRKGIPVLLRAFAEVVRSFPEARMIRAGGALTPEQSALARSLEIESRIVTLPFLSRPVLAAIYRRASLVLLPSLREGFGFPVLEALACATPVVASDLPVLREVGGDAVTYVPPGEPNALAGAVLDILASWRDRPDVAEQSRERAVRQASQFRWERTVEQFAGIYSRLAEGVSLGKR